MVKYCGSLIEANRSERLKALKAEEDLNSYVNQTDKEAQSTENMRSKYKEMEKELAKLNHIILLQRKELELYSPSNSGNLNKENQLKKAKIDTSSVKASQELNVKIQPGGKFTVQLPQQNTKLAELMAPTKSLSFGVEEQPSQTKISQESISSKTPQNLHAPKPSPTTPKNTTIVSNVNSKDAKQELVMKLLAPTRK